MKKGFTLLELLIAAAISSIVALGVFSIFSSIANMKIEIQNPDAINYLAFFLVCYSLIYSVSILVGIVIDIFNSGQTVLLDDGKK